MQPAPSLQRAADRLGLSVAGDIDALRVQRHDWTVTLDLTDLGGEDADHHRRCHGAWILVGVRLGLDKRADLDEASPNTPMKFRRTSLRRYHEAPSVHGDRLPLLVPRTTRHFFETIADDTAFSRPWLQSDLDVIVIHETGKRLDVLTDDEQRQSELTDDKRWTKTRSALFYQSYKVRPRATEQLDGGRLRIFETTEGFGAARATLLPEYDYHAAREYGYLAVPSRDCIIIARPDDQQTASTILPQLRRRTREVVDDADFALTDAIFQLEPEDVQLLAPPGFHFDTDRASPDDRLLAIDAP